MKQQAFICRAKPDGINDLSDQSIQENCLYYGLPDIPGLLDPAHTPASVEHAIREIHPEYKPKREAKLFWIFGRTMRPGDIVMTPKRLKGHAVYYIGEVTGDAYDVPGMAPLSTRYRRPVRWHNDKLPLTKANLSAELLGKINPVYNAIRTCLDISEFVTELQPFIRRGEPEVLPEPVDAVRFRQAFDEALTRSMRDTSEARLARLRTASPRPGRRIVSSEEFVRNPDVVAEALARAAGCCGRCGEPAPFRRVRNDMPYLEVHHVVPLARGGDDTIDNAIALCPNCHRYLHHGVR